MNSTRSLTSSLLLWDNEIRLRDNHRLHSYCPPTPFPLPPLVATLADTVLNDNCSGVNGPGAGWLFPILRRRIASTRRRASAVSREGRRRGRGREAGAEEARRGCAGGGAVMRVETDGGCTEEAVGST